MQYAKFKKQLLSDPKVLEEYNETKPEYIVARSLIKARLEAKMTQTEVAEKMNTSQAQIVRMESGEHLPSIQSIFKYAKAVNKKIDLLISPN